MSIVKRVELVGLVDQVSAHCTAPPSSFLADRPAALALVSLGSTRTLALVSHQHEDTKFARTLALAVSLAASHHVLLSPRRVLLSQTVLVTSGVVKFCFVFW